MTAPDTSPLIDRLTVELSWPRLGRAELPAFIAAPGEAVVFLTGNPRKEPESNDVAVILPELAAAFGHRFRIGVVSREFEAEAKPLLANHATPALVFYRDGQRLGAIPRVRDWEDYLARIRAILAGPGAQAA
jgi:hydrogenase-1 operon protein HyaE